MTIKHLVLSICLSYLSTLHFWCIIDYRGGECLKHEINCNLIRYHSQLSDISISWYLDIISEVFNLYSEILRRRSSGSVRFEITGQFLSVVIWLSRSKARPGENTNNTFLCNVEENQHFPRGRKLLPLTASGTVRWAGNHQEDRSEHQRTGL